MLQCAGFPPQWLLWLRGTGSRRTSFSSCGTQAQQLWLAGFRAQAQQLWRMGLVAPWHVGSSRTRDRTHVPCIGRRIPNHCATKGSPTFFFFNTKEIHACRKLSTDRNKVNSKGLCHSPTPFPRGYFLSIHYAPSTTFYNSSTSQMRKLRHR